ncbi:HAD family hydrolase [Gracilibacillus kekensis]|uniref:Putative hydrolase of the HAD superfamily n=1 Tax=Gracilibacillus kekensis TaxID=1027249 RepID=A0A1M7J786_9BACI|nr:hypothetical protein [Gracilibacillus kekensis]SHM48960.1 putative hydrolase of the HAD superfamily [Gracilibacillus kekensis]
MNNVQLVLDVGGVLATDLDQFWDELVSQTNLSYKEVRNIYKEEIRKQLWHGEISVESFWCWLKSTFPNIDLNYLQEVLPESLLELEGIHFVKKWSEVSDIHILSNHRTEWIKPILDHIRPFIMSATISAEVKVAKPNHKIYQICMQHLDETRPILFIDNKRENLEPAEKLGWQTILADTENLWINQVNRQLCD